MILEIIIIVAIARKFHALAKKYEQNKPWMYSVLGILSYYGSAVLISVIAFAISDIAGVYFLDEIPDFAFGLILIPFALAVTYGIYVLLERRWHREHLQTQHLKPRIADIGKPQEETSQNTRIITPSNANNDLRSKSDSDGYRF